MLRIEAEKLIPGRGAPVPGGVVVLDGASITYAGSSAEAPQTPNAEIVRTRAVMPGMWDCHAHLFGYAATNPSDGVREHPVTRAARAVPDLRAGLNAGITSVRELAGIGIHLAGLVADRTIDGPAIYAAGAALSATGGHGDTHSLPLAWMDDLSASGHDSRLCDGTADCIRAVREQLRRGAKLIKVLASGGIASEADHPIHQQLTNEELAAIVEVAGMADRVVAAHCHGKPGIIAALDAGVRTIEHGTYLDEECCDAMIETGAILVPTRTVIDALVHNSLVPDYIRRKAKEASARHTDATALAYERGVTIAAGADLGACASSDYASWGWQGREPVLLTEIGMTPLEAIEATTATAPLTLGPQAPLSGLLAAGYDADILTLDADPTTDITVLAEPSHITGVWRAGMQYKDNPNTC